MKNEEDSESTVCFNLPPGKWVSELDRNTILEIMASAYGVEVPERVWTAVEGQQYYYDDANPRKAWDEYSKGDWGKSIGDMPAVDLDTIDDSTVHMIVSYMISAWSSREIARKRANRWYRSRISEASQTQLRTADKKMFVLFRKFCRRPGGRKLINRLVRRTNNFTAIRFLMAAGQSVSRHVKLDDIRNASTVRSLARAGSLPLDNLTVDMLKKSCIPDWQWASVISWTPVEDQSRFPVGTKDWITKGIFTRALATGCTVRPSGPHQWDENLR